MTGRSQAEVMRVLNVQNRSGVTVSRRRRVDAGQMEER